MKVFIDGDHLAFVNDDFINLQSSSAVFMPLSGYVQKLPDGSLIVIDATVVKSEFVRACPKCGPAIQEKRPYRRYTCPFCGCDWKRR